MKVIIAPNALKGSMKAKDVALAIEKGLLMSHLRAECIKLPIADGGDGTMEVLVEHFKGKVVNATVDDPLGRKINAAYGLIEGGKTAVIEMATASGVALLCHDELDPMMASSYGTGQLVKAAIAQEASHVIITLGGSATVDGGLGLLQALGIKATDQYGNELGRGGMHLPSLTNIDTHVLDATINGIQFTLLCDVDNCLLGENGAARVFGPQKGATPTMVDDLEYGLANFAQVTKNLTQIDVTQHKHGGAAGGAGAFLPAYLAARVEEGSTYLMALIGLDKAIEHADVLITAEGRIDKQTLQGKGPYAVAKKAHEAGLTTIALAGQVDADLDTQDFDAIGAIIPISSGPGLLETAMAASYENLVRTSQQIGNLIAKFSGKKNTAT